MLAHMSSRERFGIYVLGAIVLMVLGYLGSSSLKGREPVTVVQESSTLDGSPQEPMPVQESVVHVVGAVKHPQVVRLKPGARIQDAIASAGGPTAEADLEAVNLAAKVEDGQQIAVPRKGAPPATVSLPEPAGRVPSRPEGATHRDAKKAPAEPVSLNQASLEQFETLPGVGPATAKRILDYRAQHGRFRSIDELRAVPGIGAKRLDKIRPWLRL